MISAPIATVVAAVIAFIGTVVGAVIAWRRWVKERESARFGKFETDRQDIYKSLWDKVEEVNASLRRNRVDERGLDQMVADLNEFMLRNGAHIDTNDVRLVNRYISSVKKFHTVIASAGAEAQIPYGATQEIPQEILQEQLAIGAAENEASTLRDELRQAVRKVLAGRP